MEIFLRVAQQVIILLILILLGVVLAKVKILNSAGVSCITDVVLLFVTPCVIIQSFIRPFEPETLRGVLLSFAAAAGVHALFIFLAHLLCRSKDEARKRVLRFGVVFTNCGYMSLPLQQALLGEDGVLYGASFIAIFNLIVWSYGITEMSGDVKYISPKKLLLNPGIIGLAAGMVLFLFSLTPPAIIREPIGYLASLNTPLPMIIIGYHLAQSDILKAFRDRECMLAIALRLVIMPLMVLGILYFLGMRGTMLTSMVIAACAPTAAITTMFSAKFGKATELSVNMVSLSTVFSVITIPCIVTLAQLIG